MLLIHSKIVVWAIYTVGSGYVVPDTREELKGTTYLRGLSNTGRRLDVAVLNAGCNAGCWTRY